MRLEGEMNVMRSPVGPTATSTADTEDMCPTVEGGRTGANTSDYHVTTTKNAS